MTRPIAAAQAPGDALWEESWVEGPGEGTIRERSDDNPAAAITLFCAWFCPFAQRAWIALEEKQVDYRYVEINTYEVDPSEPGGYTKKPLTLEEKARLYPDFVAASPRGLVPAVTHIGQHIWESVHVVEYIDSVFSGGSDLVPKHDPLKRAHVKIWADHCTDRIQKSYYVALMDQDPSNQQAAIEKFFEECRMLARAMAPESAGPYFLGTAFSLVDVALAPFWQRFELVGGHYRGLQFPSDTDFRRLKVWWEAVRQRPSVEATFVSEGRLIASYKQYANNTGTSDFAKALQGAISKPPPGPPVVPLPTAVSHDALSRIVENSTEASTSAAAEAAAAAVAASVEAAAPVSSGARAREQSSAGKAANSRQAAGPQGDARGCVVTGVIGLVLGALVAASARRS